MHDATDPMSAEAARVLQGLNPFVSRLGNPDGLKALASTLSTLQLPPIRSVTALRDFLRVYRSRVLIPTELPAIKSAYEFAARGQARELIALDQAGSCEAERMPFADVSAIIGQAQLRRLRPMRGNRVLTRYLDAISRGEAKGWHTIAYGLILASFSMPLRQGLVHYAESTLQGFAEAASVPLRLSEQEQIELVQEACSEVGTSVNELLGPSGLTVA